MRYLILLFMILSFGFGADFKKAINIVIDKKQNLMWQDNLESTEYLEDITLGKTYCENLILNGYIDWQMPTIKQLQSISDMTKNKPAIKKEFEYTKQNIYWSMTPTSWDKNRYWYVDFNTGEISHNTRDNKYTIRCIREIK